MARVYAALDTESGARLAIKVLSAQSVRDPAAAARLGREARLAQGLHHPNVCPVLGFGRTGDGLHYLVMPFLEGETLSEWELREGAMALGPGVDLVRQICHGLAHAHRHQVLHRDLKPENVMLVPDARMPQRVRAVVTDFGLAKEFEVEREVRKLTETGIVVGTPEFLSPEQVRGQPLDSRSDVFALGVLAFELLTGQLPFAGESAQELMLARLQSRPRRMRTFVPAIPERLEAAVAKALTRDPAGRYPTMDAMAEALAPFAPAGRPSETDRLRR